MRSVFSSVILLAAVAAASLPSSAVAGFTSEWDFTNGDLTASSGPGTMSYLNGSATSDLVSFNNATINGTMKEVMSYGTFSHNQGLLIDTGSTLQNYTMIWDINVPVLPSTASTRQFTTFFQMDLTNSTDASIQACDIARTGLCYDFGRGAEANYNGHVPFDSWHRIALTCSTKNDGSFDITKYVDGALVGAANYAASMTFGSSASQFLLFTDNDTDTYQGQLSAFLVADRVMGGAEIAALGGVNVAGIAVPEPSSIAVLLTAMLGLVAYAWRNRK